MAIIFKVRRAVEGIGALAGDIIVIDLDDAEYPISIVRAKPAGELVRVLRNLDAFQLLTSEASLSQLFEAAGLERPHRGHGRPSEEPAAPREGEVS